MAVRIDDQAFADLRFAVLANACQLADADHALIKAARLWRECTFRETYVLSDAVVSAVLGPNGPRAIIEAGLGERVDSGIRICGTTGRIEWRARLRANAALGGKAKASRRQTVARPDGNPDGNLEGTPDQCPLTLTLTPVKQISDPYSPQKSECANSDSVAKPDSPGLAALKAKVDGATGKRGRPRNPKPSAPTAPELASVRTILDKLSERNRVRYSMRDEHVRLIVGRLREGISEMDMRRIIVFCAERKAWEGNPEFAQYLRPETLFGPRTIAKYLDDARSWFAESEELEIERAT